MKRSNNWPLIFDNARVTTSSEIESFTCVEKANRTYLKQIKGSEYLPGISRASSQVDERSHSGSTVSRVQYIHSTATTAA